LTSDGSAVGSEESTTLIDDRSDRSESGSTTAKVEAAGVTFSETGVAETEDESDSGTAEDDAAAEDVGVKAAGPAETRVDVIGSAFTSSFLETRRIAGSDRTAFAVTERRSSTEEEVELLPREVD
jgi:hypothetical protein